MRAVRENRDYGSAVRVRYKRLLKTWIAGLSFCVKTVLCFTSL